MASNCKIWSKMEDGSESEQLVSVPAELWTYGKSELVCGKLTIETAAATYVDKGEDRHCVYVGTKGMGMLSNLFSCLFVIYAA